MHQTLIVPSLENLNYNSLIQNWAVDYFKKDDQVVINQTVDQTSFSVEENLEMKKPDLFKNQYDFFQDFLKSELQQANQSDEENKCQEVIQNLQDFLTYTEIEASFQRIQTPQELKLGYSDKIKVKDQKQQIQAILEDSLTQEFLGELDDIQLRNKFDSYLDKKAKDLKQLLKELLGNDQDQNTLNNYLTDLKTKSQRLELLKIIEFLQYNQFLEQVYLVSTLIDEYLDKKVILDFEFSQSNIIYLKQIIENLTLSRENLSLKIENETYTPDSCRALDFIIKTIKMKQKEITQSLKNIEEKFTRIQNSQEKKFLIYIQQIKNLEKQIKEQQEQIKNLTENQ